jgi:uncharacterized protein YgiB involved in biofilm formation
VGSILACGIDVSAFLSVLVLSLWRADPSSKESCQMSINNAKCKFLKEREREKVRMDCSLLFLP